MRSSLYDSGEYLERNPTYHTEDSPWKAQQILRMLRKHRFHVRSVSEIGCGSGETLRQLQLHLPEETHFYGYDISRHAFALCESRANERLHFFCADLLSIDTEPFDLLLCIDVFEHVEDYFGFLKRLRGKGHHHIFHIPLDMSVQSVLRRWPILSNRDAVGHLHYFMKDTALRTLEDSGYRIIDWVYTAAGVDLPKSPMATFARLPRKALSFINQDLAVRVLGGYSLLVLTDARADCAGAMPAR